tara:strand:+ start:1542 stop:2897 length:1356 start_codon:yes stop_codon:yes gene_type:complete
MNLIINYIKLINGYSITSCLTISFLLSFSNATYSQTGRQKTILYELNNYDSYSATGLISKSEFVENSNLTFLTERQIDWDRVLRDTILSGRYFSSEDGNSYIDGIWKNIELRDISTIRKIIRVNGIFRMSNNENEKGITINKRKSNKLTIYTLPKVSYHINILLEKFSIDTDIPNFKEQKLDSDIFDDYILNSNEVKFTFKNADVFIGTVTEKDNYGFDYRFVPNIGEYKYSTGEIFKGKMQFCNLCVGERLIPEEGTIIFTDGKVDNANWKKKYFHNLTYDEQDKLKEDSNSLTELYNNSIKLFEMKQRIMEDKQKKKELAEEEKLKKQIERQKELSSKYGNYFGEKLSQGELVPGMNADMVNEIWEKNWFSISNLVRNGQMLEIWEWDKSKFQMDMLEKGKKNKDNGGKDYAAAMILGLELAEQFGASSSLNIPKTLVFKNDKLTDIYR